MRIVKALTRWARVVGRRLEPPGNRTPLDESLEQQPGLSSIPPPMRDRTGPAPGPQMGDRFIEPD
jgi:hypothetical protein